MIIYTEDLSPRRLTAADFTKDGRAAAQWDAVSKELLERATKDLKMLP